MRHRPVDTWTKAETWEAGRDRNERDDTVYFGQQGNFRGFLAAQEGYLTDGESGVTGISRDRIFEFPEEPRRGKKTVRFRVRSGSAATDTCPDPHPTLESQPAGTLICTGWGQQHSSYFQGHQTGETQDRARNRYAGQGDSDQYWEVDWRTNVRYTRGGDGTLTEAGNGGGGFRSPDWWRARAEERVIPACRARGGKYVAGSADFGPGHNDNAGVGDNVYFNGDNHGWFYAVAENSLNPGTFARRARESRTWVGVCTKRVRRR